MSLSQSSPYGGEIVKAFFADKETAWVHMKVIEPYPGLMRRVGKAGAILGFLLLDLTNLEPPTAHIVLHFLYTGKYQCLKAPVPKRLGKIDKARYELVEALQACIACSSLQLIVLKYLAEKEIERLSDKLSLSHIFEYIDIMDFQLNLVPTFKTYIQSRMMQAKFGGSGDTTNDVLLDLGGTNTLGTLTLETMILQHQSRMKAGGKENHASVDAIDTHAATALKSTLQPTLQSINFQISLLEKVKLRQGGKLHRKNEEHLSRLRADAKSLSRGKATVNREKTFVVPQDDAKFPPTATEPIPDDAVEAWLIHDGDSKDSYLSDPDANGEDITTCSLSLDEMTPSSNGSSYGLPFM